MATIASLVVSIGADIASLVSGVNQANAKMDSFGSQMKNTFDLLAKSSAFLLAGKIITDIVSAATEIDDLSARINETAANVQHLQAISSEFDVEMSGVVGAIQEMEARLASGKIDEHLERLNITVAEFKNMSPAEKYIAVMSALGKLESQTDKTSIATGLMGKNWKANVGAMDENVESAKRYVVMNDETVAAIDASNSAFWNASISAKNFIANAFTSHIEDGSMNEAIDGIKRYAEALNELPKMPDSPRQSFLSLPPDLPKDYNEINKSLTETAKQAIKFNEAAERAAEASRRHKAQLAEQLVALQERFRLAEYFARIEGVDVRAALVAGNDALQLEIGYLQDINQEMDTLRFASTDAAATFVDMAASLEPFKKGVTDSGELIRTVMQQRAQETIVTWAQVGQRLSGAIMGALQGGGSVGKALGGEAGQMLGTKLGSSIGEWAGRVLPGKLGAAIGGAAGSILPVVGTMLGSALGSIGGSLIGKLFGGNKEKKEIQTAMQSLDFASVKARAEELGISMAAVFSAKKVDDFKAALAGVNAQIAEQDQLHQRGIAAMEKYGITIEQAGAKFKQTQMNATAQSLVEDFHALVAIGVDTDTIIQKMGSSIGEFVHRSIEMGTSVPREMEPIIRKMIETGSLVDKNGEKFTELGQIPWAENPNAAMQKLIDKIGALIDLISSGIPDALNRLPKNTEIGIKVKVDDSELDRFGGRNPQTTSGSGSDPAAYFGQRAAMLAGASVAPIGSGGETHVHIHGGVFDGYQSEQTFARRVLDALSGERERRGRALAYGAA